MADDRRFTPDEIEGLAEVLLSFDDFSGQRAREFLFDQVIAGLGAVNDRAQLRAMVAWKRARRSRVVGTGRR